MDKGYPLCILRYQISHTNCLPCLRLSNTALQHIATHDPCRGGGGGKLTELGTVEATAQAMGDILNSSVTPSGTFSAPEVWLGVRLSLRPPLPLQCGQEHKAWWCASVEQCADINVIHSSLPDMRGNVFPWYVTWVALELKLKWRHNPCLLVVSNVEGDNMGR